MLIGRGNQFNLRKKPQRENWKREELECVIPVIRKIEGHIYTSSPVTVIGTLKWDIEAVRKTIWWHAPSGCGTETNGTWFWGCREWQKTLPRNAQFGGFAVLSRKTAKCLSLRAPNFALLSVFLLKTAPFIHSVFCVKHLVAILYPEFSPSAQLFTCTSRTRIKLLLLSLLLASQLVQVHHYTELQ